MKFQEQEEREKGGILVGRSLKSIQERLERERKRDGTGVSGNEKNRSGHDTNRVRKTRREEKHGTKKEKAPQQIKSSQNNKKPKQQKKRERKENPFTDFNDFSIPIIKITTLQFSLSYPISESRLQTSLSISTSLSLSVFIFFLLLTYFCLFGLGRFSWFPCFFFFLISDWVFFFFWGIGMCICIWVDLSCLFVTGKRTDSL